MTPDDDRGGRRPYAERAGASASPRLVLASASPRRRDILRQLDLDPEIRSADVDEAYLPGESPEEHVERLARAKSMAVAQAMTTGGGRRPVRDLLVVGGDTVVLHGVDVLVKPEDEADAVRTLMTLSGRSHRVLSGLAVTSVTPEASGLRTVSGVSRTEVHMRTFDEAAARSYVATGEPLDKAGSYGIQGRGAALVEGVDGDYYSVVGFPVGLFLDLLARVGWRFDFGSFTPASSTT